MQETNYKSYHSLIAHQKADVLAMGIYQATKGFPQEELFGLVNQMRRSAISVPANIAEGYSRRWSKEKVRFYNIAQGSLVELRYYIEFSEKLGYITVIDFKELISQIDEVAKLLCGLIRSTNNKGNLAASAPSN